ncbi:MAG TPA: tagaturonate reductase [Pelobium sp.]
MQLSRNNLNKINNKTDKPRYQNLPEKVLQFGTGVLLKALPDYYIHKANNKSVFNGSIAVVKSTSSGGVAVYEKQDNLYTICVRGVKGGTTIHQNIISGAISRVLTATTDWNQILKIAESENLEVVISNTTEAGIQLVEDDIFANPPVSFPAKLLAVLYQRFNAFKGDKSKGLVIIPTELIVDNADKLKDILLVLTEKQQLPLKFIDWLNDANYFCNSLVDRIVPGTPDKKNLPILTEELGYTDELLTMCESYSLWAIQGNETVKQKLTFATTDANVVITPDIKKFRELKLRLLNGTHTLTCGVAYLAGFDTVNESTDDKGISYYLETLMKTEITPSIPFPLEKEEALAFADDVLDRFKNPHIKHQWLSISMNYTTKLKTRVLPILLNFQKKFDTTPELMALGFAAYLKFVQVAKVEENQYYGYANDKFYLINDDKIAYIHCEYQKNTSNPLAILKDRKIWGEDLTELKNFEQKVHACYRFISQNSIKEFLTRKVKKRNKQCIEEY